MRKKYDWPGVEYASPEYYRLYRKANIDKLRLYARGYNANRYKTHPEQEKARRKRWAIKNPDKVRSHQLLNGALKRGRVTKKPCPSCGSLTVVAHHYDYSKPLDVIWVCEVHHKAIHNKSH